MVQYLCVDAAKSLPKDKLVQLVLRQQELIRRLEEQVAELQRSGKRQAAPFSRDNSQAEPQKAGRKKGQGRFTYRPIPAPETITETKTELLRGCPCCGGVLTDLRSVERFQLDLPSAQLARTRFATQSGYCEKCKRRQESRHPEQLSQATGAARVSLGPRVLGLGADLKHRLGLSFEKTSELLEQAYGLQVSRSALCQADQRLAAKALPVYEELVVLLRRCVAVHADETGWRIGGLNAWLWSFCNSSLTVYTVAGRSHEVIVKMLGEEFRGTLISDCFSAYDHGKFAHWMKQKCLAHLLKDLSQMEAAKSGKALCFAREVAAVLRGALDLRDRKPSLQPGQFKYQARLLEGKLDLLIAPERRFSDADNRRFAQRLRKQRPHLLRFLYQDGVDATNNQAERSLRPAVIVRKTGGCNRTAAGAQNHAVLASILVTARQRGLPLLDVMVQLQRTTTEGFCKMLNAAVVPEPNPP